MSKYAVNKFKKDFQKALSGEVFYIPLTQHGNTDNLSKLGSCVTLGKSLYLLFGGNSGSGKTSVLDSNFIINLYRWWKRNKEEASLTPYWIYRSMERNREKKVAKWFCYLLFINHNLLVDVNTVMNKPNKKFDPKETVFDVNDKKYTLENLVELYEPELLEMMEHIDIIDGSSSPEKVKNYALDKAFQEGKYFTTVDNKLLVNGKVEGDFENAPTETKAGSKVPYLECNSPEGTIKVHQEESLYIPNDPKTLRFHVTDHIGKLTGNNPKTTIDEHTHNMGKFRDIFGWCVIDVTQLNRDNQDPRRKENEEPTILDSDFKGSAAPFENCDIALGFMNPYRVIGDSFESYLGYGLNELIDEFGKERFRSIKIVKNSDDTDDITLGLMFYGECGFTYELPVSRSMRNNDENINYYELIKENKKPF